MGATTDKGELGEAMVIADLVRRGFGVALPLGHSWPFDLVLIRPDGTLERVQVKYARSDGAVLPVKCASTSGWVQYSYHAGIVDWIAVWDSTTGDCFYLPIGEARHREVRLRLRPPRNGQRKGIRWADDYRNL
jgi:hypothetical protein